MKHLEAKTDLFEKLQKEIFSLQGFAASTQSKPVDFGLGAIEKNFPNGVFPLGAVHELVSSSPQEAAATAGFMAGLLGSIMQRGGHCLWISRKRTLFPPALKFFGVDPDRVIFIDVHKDKDLLWIIEESLKCQALCGVIAEIKELSLTDSRRLQLAVEKSRVTGLIHRINPNVISNSACAARWKITPVASSLEADMPGVGFFSWEVSLLKVRNGQPGQWQIRWTNARFEQLPNVVPAKGEAPDHDLLKTG